jgi:hypothetical protein
MVEIAAEFAHGGPKTIGGGAVLRTAKSIARVRDDAEQQAERQGVFGDGVVFGLSPKAAAFLLGTVRHLNQEKILPADSAQALETSAWLEEIEARCSAALENA